MEDNKEIIQKENSISALMAIVSIIPHIGSAINEVFFERRSRIKQARVNNFVTELGKSVRRLDESKINREYIHSDEFGDILESTFKKVMEHGTTLRILRFKNILLNQTILNFENSIIETFLNVVTTLTEQQLLLLENYQINESKLKRFNKRLKEEEKLGSRSITFTSKKVTLENADVHELRNLYDSFLDNIYKQSGVTDDHNVEFFIQDLVSKSLLSDISFTIKNRKPNDILLLTNYGKMFLRFIIEYKDK